MTCIDLIIELSKLPPEVEVVYDNTEDGKTEFKLIIVHSAEEIETNTGERLILLNAKDIEDE